MMNPVDIILIVLIAGAVILAVRKMIRNKKQGKCSCGRCDGSGNCSSKSCEKK